MLGLAIVSYLVAALFIVLAFRPALLVFYVREGWKFRERLRPSGLYSGVTAASCLIAGLLARWSGPSS